MSADAETKLTQNKQENKKKNDESKSTNFTLTLSDISRTFMVSFLYKGKLKHCHSTTTTTTTT